MIDKQNSTRPARRQRRPAEATVNVELCCGSLDAIFRSDGTGALIDKNYDCQALDAEPFEHSLDTAIINAAKKGKDGSIQMLEEAFWSDVNPQLDDPYVAPDGFDDQELKVSRGTLEQFEDLLRDAMLTDQGQLWEELDEALLVINAETDEEGPEIREAWGDVGEANGRLSYKTQTVIGALISYFGPEGQTWEYNDGAHAQRSGFDACAETIEVTATRPTATQRAEAVRRLLLWAAEQGQDRVTEALNGPPAPVGPTDSGRLAA